METDFRYTNFFWCLTGGGGVATKQWPVPLTLTPDRCPRMAVDDAASRFGGLLQSKNVLFLKAGGTLQRWGQGQGPGGAKQGPVCTQVSPFKVPGSALTQPTFCPDPNARAGAQATPCLSHKHPRGLATERQGPSRSRFALARTTAQIVTHIAITSKAPRAPPWLRYRGRRTFNVRGGGSKEPLG